MSTKNVPQLPPVDHELKEHPLGYIGLLEGRRYEIRKDDRGGFRPGQIVRIKEWDDVAGYSGRSMRAVIVDRTVGLGLEAFAPGARLLAPGVVVFQLGMVFFESVERVRPSYVPPKVTPMGHAGSAGSDVKREAERPAFIGHRLDLCRGCNHERDHHLRLAVGVCSTIGCSCEKFLEPADGFDQAGA